LFCDAAPKTITWQGPPHPHRYSAPFAKSAKIWYKRRLWK